MRSALPKPIHGWRVFWGEVGIIVLGVLIALGAQQFVETLHDRGEAREARESIRGEIETNMARLASRSAIRSCVDRRLAEIQALLDEADVTGVIKTPQWIGRPQLWTMLTARWDASAQAGRAALLPANELAEFGLMYSWMRNINAEMVIEQGDWAELRTLEHLQRITPEGLFNLKKTVEDARYRRWQSISKPCSCTRRPSGLGLRPPAMIFRSRAHLRADKYAAG